MENEIILNVKKHSTWKFILLNIVTLGYYFYFWLWDLLNDINNLDFEQGRKMKFWEWAILPLLLNVYNIYQTIITWDMDGFTTWDKFYARCMGTIYLVIAIFLLNKLEEYAQKKYNVKIKHNILGLVCFNVLYVNFALNTFQKRVKKVIDKNGN